jgi:flagellar hook-associated protein 3 FlgL
MQIFNSGVRHIGNAQAEVARTQDQLSSGRRVLTPADDPAAAALELGIRQEKARSAQYQRNADLGESDLRQQEAELETVHNVVLRVRELALQAGNATLSVAERAVIVADIDQATEQLVGLLNSRSASGDYLFAGFSGDTPPFVATAAGRVDYAGDEGTRMVEVGAELAVQTRNNGRELFVDIPAAAATFTTRPAAGNTGSGEISGGRIVDQTAYDAVHPDDLVVSFVNPPGSYVVDQVDHVTGAVTAQLASGTYTPGEALTVTVAGAEVRIVGAPATGDGFVLEAGSTQPLLLTVQRLADGLRAVADTPAGAQERARVIAEALQNLDLAGQSLSASRADIGPRLNQLDDARAGQQALDLINDETLSDMVDLDYDEAASRLSFQSFVLQAAQQSLAKIANLSLFSFLR